MTDAIRTEHLHKQFRIGVRGYGYDTFRERLADVAGVPVRRLLGRARSSAPDGALIHALDDVSLRVGQGEVVGIIGNNGAGKSTLLKVLSRITEPTAGWAEISGRVGSLLEVGTGFHPELTGRENIMLNGAVLGMRRAEIRRQFDEIVAFADIEQFLETPVKRYSSGMYVRLAFSVAAHLQTEVLIVDEVLAVGDAAFQRKCLGRMDAAAREGRTVLFVSHNMAVIQALCQRGIFLRAGQVMADAPVDEAIAHYLRSLEQMMGTDLLDRTDRRGWHRIMVSAVEARQPDGSAPATGRPARFTVTVTGLQPRSTCTLTILNHLGQPVSRLESGNVGPRDHTARVDAPDCPAQFTCDVAVLPLLPGRYRIDVQLRGTHQVEDEIDSASMFDVEPGLLAGRPVPVTGVGDVALDHRWTVPVL
ncbi:MAG: polysaccharide ABC transporter ATP-binding protein [Nocardioidaceae bacterium]